MPEQDTASATDAKPNDNKVQPSNPTDNNNNNNNNNNINNNTKQQQKPTTKKTILSVQDERKAMKETGYKMQVAGDTWYPISKKWWDSWKEYTCFDKGDEDVPGGLENLHKNGKPRPGKIDNSELQAENDEHALKLDIQENLTHYWIHSSKWDLIYKWYGGGPIFPRKVYEKGSSFRKETYICKDPKLIKITFVDPKTGDINDNCKSEVIGFPKNYQFREIAKDFEDKMEGWDENEEKDDTCYVHVWGKFKTLKQIFPVDKKVTVTDEDLKEIDPETWIEIPDDYLKIQIDEIESDENPYKTVVDHLAIEYIQWTKEDKKSETKEDDSKKNDNNNDSNVNNNENNGNNNGGDNDDDNNSDDDNDFSNNMSNSNNNNNDDDEKKYFWPRAVPDDKWQNFFPGQIIDVQDMQQGKWYEVFIRKVILSEDKDPKKTQLIVHYIGWAVKWDEKLLADQPQRVANRGKHTKGPHRPNRSRRGYGGGGNMYGNYYSSWGGYGYSHDEGKPDQKGVVGLRNLGNTCFMNSTLQCLAQAPFLTDYFLKNEYIHHINKDNPLGWKGKVATAWGQLLHDMFSNKYRTIAPRQFKDAIGEVAPRFTGYAQQDSQELLSFLLDGLHEDLNQIVNKPATEAVESNGRKDAIVAAEAWKTYLKRNQSIIVDLMQGQYKSKVVCPDCGRVSITFDPYMFLSVPLPTQKYKVVEYTWVDCADLSVTPKVYGMKINKFYDINSLKKSLANRHKVNASELYVCDIWKSKFHRELKKHDTVAEINRRNDDIFVYHAPKPKKDEIELKEDPKDENDNNNNNNNEPGNAGNGNNNNNNNDDRDDNNNHMSGGRDYMMNNNYEMYRRRNRSEYSTILIVNNRRVKVSRSEYGYDDEMTEDEALGMPLLMSVHIKQKITLKQLRIKIFNMIEPFLRAKNEKPPKKKKKDNNNDDDDDNENNNNNNNENNNDNDPEIEENIGKPVKYKYDDEDLPFRIFATWGFQNNQEIFANDEEFDFDRSELKFIIHWSDYTKYKHELYKRSLRQRDATAPALPSKYGNDDDDDNGGRFGRPIELDACFEAFTEEEKLGENDAWYCSKCKGFKRASKKIDLWTVPDILIIHLKRFSYTRNYRDRINTLVKFPINGLDVSEFLVNKYERKNAIYDLFAISNHMGGMGGGHYTAYAKNLFNKQWYQLDDSRTSPVGNPNQMVSSSAYVLYYARRNPFKKRQKATNVQIPSVERAMSMENLEELAKQALLDKQKAKNNDNNKDDNDNNKQVKKDEPKKDNEKVKNNDNNDNNNDNNDNNVDDLNEARKELDKQENNMKNKQD